MDLSTMERKKIGSYTEENLRIMSAQILSVMESIRGNGFVYQDLKPNNILFNAQIREIGLSNRLWIS